MKVGNIRVEYVIYYLKLNNAHNKKVFMISRKWDKINFEKYLLKNRVSKISTTRKHYLGKHFINTDKWCWGFKRGVLFRWHQQLIY